MNKIPRNIKYIIATCLSGNAEGRRMRITHDNNGYHGVEEDNGNTWYVFLSHLRNEHCFRIEKIVTGEE